MVQHLQNKRPKAKNIIDLEIAQLQKIIADKPAAPIGISNSKNGKDNIVIRYDGMDELKYILEKMS